MCLKCTRQSQFKKPGYVSPKRRFSESQELAICERYTDGKSADSIGRELSTSATVILNVLKRHSVERRIHTRTYTLNTTVFDTTNEHSAYWAGFLMADGSIQYKSPKSATIKLSLHQKDRTHIGKFRSFLGSSHKISESKNTAMCEIVVNSRHIADALAQWGIVPRKSKTAQVVGLEDDRHFWRGVIDGDGCLQINKKGCPYISLVGALPLVTQFAGFAKKAIGRNSLSIMPHRSIYSVVLGGRSAVALINLLYGNASIALDRKCEIAHRVFELAQSKPSYLQALSLSRDTEASV